MADYNLTVIDCDCFSVQFVLPEHAVYYFLTFVGLGPEDVVAVESGVQHLSIGSELVGYVYVLSMDLIFFEVGWIRKAVPRRIGELSRASRPWPFLW